MGPYSALPVLLGPAAPHLQRADVRLAETLRAVVAADHVTWVSEAAVQYRASLADAMAALRAVQRLLEEAVTLAITHDAAVELARQTSPQPAIKAFRELFSGPTSGTSLDPGR
jgi:hypothetical protein